MKHPDEAERVTNDESNAESNARRWTPRRHGTPAAARTAQVVTQLFEAVGVEVWLVPAADWPAALVPASIDPAQWPGVVPYGFAPLFGDVVVGPEPTRSRFCPNDAAPTVAFERHAAICADILEMTLVGVPDDVVEAYAEYWVLLLTALSDMDNDATETTLHALGTALAKHQGATRSEFVQRLMLRALDLATLGTAGGADDGGWTESSKLAASVGFEVRGVRDALRADRHSRQRRPGRDRRWRDPSWIHETEIPATLDRYGATYWAAVRTETRSRATLS
jgi:hypothetical protein